MKFELPGGMLRTNKPLQVVYFDYAGRFIAVPPSEGRKHYVWPNGTRLRVIRPYLVDGIRLFYVAELNEARFEGIEFDIGEGHVERVSALEQLANVANAS